MREMQLVWLQEAAHIANTNFGDAPHQGSFPKLEATMGDKSPKQKNRQAKQKRMDQAEQKRLRDAVQTAKAQNKAAGK